MAKDREYFIDYNKPDEAAMETLRMHIDTLASFRRSTPHPEELEWEIRLYEYMQQDPANRLKQYQEARYDDDHMIKRSKREVAAVLGWDVK